MYMYTHVHVDIQITVCVPVISLLFFITINFPPDLDIVECSSTVNCTDVDLGIMPARDCCVGMARGLAYTVPSTATCQVCIGT